ncbi:MAG: hypothetical protein AVO39_08435 [delta proteobacterium MLS_D]|jgi:phenylacetic acid degradation protein|nr:MAG: hypothetical protein AVO39_08435 [delta proteobacterium MLS_D]
MPSYQLQGKSPRIDADAFIHPEAVIIGEASIGAGCFVGPGAVIRADFGPVTLGEGVSLQDNAVIHVSPGSRVLVEDDCIIGHGALLHDVHLARGCVIGMGAILLFDVVCGKESFVAAGAVVTRGTKIPEGSVAAGNPAEIIRQETSPERIREARDGARLYRELAASYRESMKHLS